MPLVVANRAWRSAPGFCAAFPYISRAQRSSAASTRFVLLAMWFPCTGEYPVPSADAFRVRHGVPEGGIRPRGDPAHMRERLVDLRAAEQGVRDDRLPCGSEDEVQVLDER